MQSINPSKNVNRRGRFYGSMGVLVFLLGLIGSAFGILLSVLPLFGEGASGIGAICFNIVGIPIALGGIGLIIRAFTLKKDNLYAYEVGEYLKQTSLNNDARYTFIRNISHRRLGYIDGVLVGPPGALVFRTVNYTGGWINERTEWRRRSKGGRLQKANTNPTKECARDVYALREFYKNIGLDKVPVYGIVVFVTPAKNLDLKADGPVIPVTSIDYLFHYLKQDYLSAERINSPTIRKATDSLID